ncbi:uncharacterized protein LOC120415808 [Culex pipiens pallens]|uniref:uncharacterized protein LOC120415808 n=1 Tax=Culex pipiens pallens TaxID=42434 RepID=UPI0019548E67|nr:uncharacterized protein LOC120415808 [Culex pipiens pallens]XP_052567180.1 uncharacterized protein LOC120415808 [Culex pipiens pallens]
MADDHFDFTDAEEIITCSYCEQTYHSRCVDNTAADTEWYCPEGCRNNPDDSAEQAREQPDAAIEMDCPAVGQAEEFDAERWIREKQIEIELELAERQAQIDRELREKEDKMAEAIRKVMRRQEANLELERKNKANHERRMAVLQSSFERRSSLIDEQLELTKYGFEKILQCPQVVDLTSEEEAEDEKKIERDESSSETSEDHDGKAKSRAKDAGESGAKLNKQDVSRTLYGLGQQGSGLEKAQLAAGGGLTRKFPCYPNDPKPLPKSYGAQQESSEACGVSDGQNPAKLRYRLKGAVQDTGHCSPHLSQPVIEKQRQVVDHPEPLQRSHPASTRGHEHSAANGKLATLTTLESTADQLYERTEATDVTLVNPLAIEDPASVLPNKEERLWATKKAEMNNFSSRNKPDKIAGANRRRQIEDANLCCREEGSSSLSRANQMQPRVRHDCRLRFCQGTEELFDDERTKIIVNWMLGDVVECLLEVRGQDVARQKPRTLGARPVTRTGSTSMLKVLRIVPHHGDTAFADEATTVALIVGAKAVLMEHGAVLEMLASQRTAVTNCGRPGITRINGLAFMVSTAGGCNRWIKAEELSAQDCSVLAADRGQLAKSATASQHQATAKDPDKPKDHSPLLDSVACDQHGPADPGPRSWAKSSAGCTRTSASGSMHDSGIDVELQVVYRDCLKVKTGNLIEMWTNAQDDLFLEKLRPRPYQNHGTPLRNPDIGLLSRKKAGGCTAETEVTQNLEEVGGKPLTVNTNVIEKRVNEKNLQELDDMQKLTDGNVGKATNSSSVNGEQGVVGVSNDQEEVYKLSQEQEGGREAANTAVLKVSGKSDAPDGPTDVTGWGVTTAEMATLPYGVEPAV